MPAAIIERPDLSPEQEAAVQGKALQRAERVELKGPTGDTISLSRKAARIAEQRGYAIKGDSSSQARADRALAVQGEKGYIGTAPATGYSPPSRVIGDSVVQTLAHVLASNPGLRKQLAEAIAAGGTTFPDTPDVTAAARNAADEKASAKAKAARESSGGDGQVSATEPLSDEEIADEATTVAQLEAEAERLEVSKAGPKAELRTRIQEARAAAGTGG